METPIKGVILGYPYFLNHIGQISWSPQLRVAHKKCVKPPAVAAFFWSVGRHQIWVLLCPKKNSNIPGWEIPMGKILWSTWDGDKTRQMILKSLQNFDNAHMAKLNQLHSESVDIELA